MVSSHRAWLIFPWTRTFPPNWMLVWRVQGRSFVTSLWPHLTSLLRAHPGGIFSDILHTLGLSLAEFQAPLFCSLAISPIILFRTCQLQSSCFGQHYYISVSKFPSSTFELCSPADLVFDQPGWYKAAFPTWDRIIDLERFISCCMMSAQCREDDGKYFRGNCWTRDPCVILDGQIQIAQALEGKISTDMQPHWLFFPRWVQHFSIWSL